MQKNPVQKYKSQYELCHVGYEIKAYRLNLRVTRYDIQYKRRLPSETILMEEWGGTTMYEYVVLVFLQNLI
jgi:hypothetical protein